MSEVNNHHFKTESGIPNGGSASGTGFTIVWQRGPLLESGRNGAFIEEILSAVVSRLEFFQESACAHPRNEEAIQHINDAVRSLNSRTEERQARGVEGSYVK